jgi:CheY-like chemotaxis protein
VAEDNLVNQRLVTAILEKAGHTVVAVDTGQRAVEAAATGAFDIVLMDMQMPGMDGLQATTLIREAEHGTRQRLPIVALTAHATTADVEACARVGMDRYLAKPVRRAALLAAIDELLRFDRSEAPQRLEPAFDVDDALGRVEGDHELLAEVVQIFDEESPRMLAEIGRAVESGDAPALQRAAHALRGSVISLGARPAAQVALALETMARQGRLAGARPAYVELQQAVDRLSEALRSFVEIRA